MPTDPGLAAFTDRFLLRARVTPVALDRFDELIHRGAKIEAERMAGAISANVRATGADGNAHTGPGTGPGSGFTVRDINRISSHLSEVNTEAVGSHYRRLVRSLLQEGAEFSDRRIVQGLKLVRGATLLRRSTAARPADLWPLAHVWTVESDEHQLREMVHRIVADDGGDPLDSVTAEQIVRAAGFAVDRFERDEDRSSDAIDAALIEINQLRVQLVDRHPAAHAERDRLDALSQRIQRYHDPGLPAPTQPPHEWPERDSPMTGGEHV